MFFAGDPEEAQAMMQKLAEQQDMAQDVLRHEVERFFDSLDKEQLVALRHVMRATHGEGYAEYVAGLIGGILKYKYNVCGCGRDHDQELLAGPTETSEQTDVTGGVNRADQMEVYDVRSPSEAEGEYGGGPNSVICRTCGQVYVSLEDRMLREPGVKGCEGCQHQARWG